MEEDVRELVYQLSPRHRIASPMHKSLHHSHLRMMVKSLEFKYLCLLFTVHLLAGGGECAAPAAALESSSRDLEWSGHKRADSNLQVLWKYNSEDESVTFSVRANVTGYVAIGITQSGSMQKADIFFGWVSDGVAHMKDCHGPARGNGVPVVDEEQNLVNVSGEERDGETRLTFTRKLRVACSRDGEDIDVTGDTANMIYAYHKEKEPSSTGEITNLMQHLAGNRGHFYAYLLSYGPPHHKLPPDTITMEMRLKNSTVPSYETSLWCQLFKVSRADDLGGRKHHIIMTDRFLARPESPSGPFIHHFNFKRCTKIPEDWKEEDEKPGGEICLDTASKMMRLCLYQKEMVTGWALGSQAVYLPKDAGIPVGTEETEYFMIEMHFHNPELKKGVKVDSGVSLALTPTLRKHDAGAMELGFRTSPDMVVPPRMANYDMEAACHMNCTLMNLPSDGIHVYATIFHAHMLAREVTVRHYRGDDELPYIMHDSNYNTNYQPLTRLSEERIVMPGDAIATRCRYDSTNRDRVTLGGESSRKEEMCVSFLFYYPLTPLTFCLSDFPPPESLFKVFHLDITYSKPHLKDLDTGFGYWTLPTVTVEGKNVTWIRFLLDHRWNDDEKMQVENIGREADRIYSCRNKQMEATEFTDQPVRVTNPYRKPTTASDCTRRKG